MSSTNSENSIKDNKKSFFKRDSTKWLFWLIIWLIEYFTSKWYLRTNPLSEAATININIIIVAFVLFFIIIWVKLSESKEMIIYSLLIIAYIVNRELIIKLYTSTFNQPVSYLVYWIIAYVIFRIIFPFNWLHNEILANVEGFIAYLNERSQEKRNRRETVQKKREERLDQRRKRIETNLNAHKDFWHHFFKTARLIIKGLLGLGPSFIEGFHSSYDTDEETKSKKPDSPHPAHAFYVVLYIIVLISLLSLSFYVIRSSDQSDFWLRIFNNGQSLPEKITTYLEILVSLFNILCEHSHNMFYPQELLIRIFCRKAA